MAGLKPKAIKVQASYLVAGLKYKGSVCVRDYMGNNIKG